MRREHGGEVAETPGKSPVAAVDVENGVDQEEWIVRPVYNDVKIDGFDYDKYASDRQIMLQIA